VNISIPIGCPAVMKEFDQSGFYYVQLNITSFKCKHVSDPYPLLTSTGVNYMDKIWFEMLCEHYDFTYEFISGYSFKAATEPLKKITQELWDLRMSIRSRPEQAIVKTVINSWYGKSIFKWKPVSEKLVEPKRLQEYIAKHPLIYSYRRKGDKYDVKTIRPIYAPIQRPQFAVGVLSYSRKMMQDIIYKCVDMGVDVLYCNTDSILVRTCDASLVPLKIGSGLGEFKVELESCEFICLSTKKKIHLLLDGSVKNTFGKSDMEYFRKEYEKY
jgi:hypothetical protein